jgi:hypothetical protein
VKEVATLPRMHTFELGLAQVLFAAMQIYIPWLAAFVPGVPLSELATLSLAQSFVWPLAMVAQLQLRALYVSRGERSLFPLFIQLRLGACILLVAVTAVAAVFLRQGLALFAIAVTLALIKSVEGFADIMQCERQRTMDLRPVARSQSWRCAIFIGVYSVALVVSGELVTALAAALACSVAWVLAADLGPLASWRVTLAQRVGLEHALPTLRTGLTLSAAVALTSLAAMVGRWAALRAGDIDTVAAAALAGTIGSVVAVVMGTTQHYSLAPARTHLASGGMDAFRAWYRGVTLRLHLLMAFLALVWLAVALLSWHGVLPFADHLGSQQLQHTVIVLAGCFIAGGWLSAPCIADTVLLYLQHRYAVILLLAAAQLAGAAAASFALYPAMGWAAIGVAEIVRALVLVGAVRIVASQRRAAHEAAC